MATRFICTVSWKIIGAGDMDAVDKNNDCPEFQRLIGSRQTCGNCRFVTHEGSERYHNFVRTHPGIVPEQLPEPVKSLPDFKGHKFIVLREYTCNLRKPYIALLERIKTDPNFYPKGNKQIQMVVDLLDSCSIYDTATMIPADQLTYDKTIELFNANPDKRNHFIKCHDKTPEDFFRSKDHNNPEHYQHFLLCFKIEVKS